MHLVRTVAFLLLLAGLGGGCANQPISFDPVHPEVADIVEAVFRYEFEHNASGASKSVKAYFLAILDIHDNSQDPSAAFLARFAENQPPVRKASAAWQGGLIFKAGAVRSESPTKVFVQGGYYQGNLSSSGCTYVVEKQNGKWVVTESKNCWISQNAAPEKLPSLKTIAAVGPSKSE